ncbi:mediator of DNA damage checkpoint protein 1-like, partial [Saccoglossus kowalevskii]|uniref:PAX-interacting protein 1 n=1 Tax=Saccoglossus kowalevskii TaxID=10224 RepID=A0ABM0LZ96_SACKO
TVVSLGGELVDSVYECTHLVTDKVRRTVKFLCGLSRGILIVNSQWLESSRQAHRFLDATSYIVKDNSAEQQYGFQLSESREKALNGGVLQGYKIHVTSKVAPGPQQMKDIIKCAAGEVDYLQMKVVVELEKENHQSLQQAVSLNEEKDEFCCQS